MQRWVLGGAIALSLVLASCQFVRFDGDDEAAPGLTDTAWALVHIETTDGGVLPAPGDGFTYAVRFTPEGTMRALDACNWCGAPYTRLGERLRYGDGACTDQLCVGQQLDYRGALFGADRFALRDGLLRLRSGDGRVLVHAPAPVPELAEGE